MSSRARSPASNNYKRVFIYKNSENAFIFTETPSQKRNRLFALDGATQSSPLKETVRKIGFCGVIKKTPIIEHVELGNSEIPETSLPQKRRMSTIKPKNFTKTSALCTPVAKMKR